MRPEIKFCGLTRPEDAECAATLGARYVGVIFAGGPRNIDPGRAATVLDAAGPTVRRVGVVARAIDPDISHIARTASLHVVQLHDDPTPDEVARVRSLTGCEVWAVMRLRGAELPSHAPDVFAAADAVLLDARAGGQLGGTGVTLPWDRVATGLRHVRVGRRVILAGGLTPRNVRMAIAELEPDVVDVSSGVETSPGVKDPQLMRDFVEAVSL